MKIVDYDEENDILYLHKGFAEGEEFETNMVFGDFILDISTKGNVVGLEIMDARDYFEGKLVDLREADFEVVDKKDSKLITLRLEHKTMKMILAHEGMVEA